MDQPSTVFITAAPGSPAPTWVIGGLTVLERRLREAARRGATRAIVACDGPLPTRPVAIAIERAAPGAEPPAGAEVVRADELAGVPLATRADARRAEWALLWGLPKSFQGPVDALINCHVSLRITRVLCRLPVTPNHVTMLAIVIGVLAGALLVVSAAPSARVAAGAALFFQSVFDSCDGELARLRYQFSAFGQWLDNIADDVIDATVIAALGAAVGGAWLWLGLAAAAGRGFTQLALYLQVRALGGEFTRFRWWFESDVASVDEVYDPRSWKTIARSFGRRDVYVFLWAVLVALSPWVPALLVVAAGYGVAISAGYVILTALHLVLAPRAARRA